MPDMTTATGIYETAAVPRQNSVHKSTYNSAQAVGVVLPTNDLSNGTVTGAKRGNREHGVGTQLKVELSGHEKEN